MTLSQETCQFLLMDSPYEYKGEVTLVGFALLFSSALVGQKFFILKRE